MDGRFHLWVSVRKGCDLMSSPDDLSATSGADIHESPKPAVSRQDTDPPSASNPAPGPSGRMWVLVLGAGLLAGLASFALGEAAPSIVSPPNVRPEIAGSGPQASAELEREMRRFRDQVAVLAYGGLGLALGPALGAAGGLSHPS